MGDAFRDKVKKMEGLNRAKQESVIFSVEAVKEIFRDLFK